MDINTAFPSKWLKSEDVQGAPVIATITSCEMVTLKTEGGEDIKPAVFFEETEKGLILNRTNANMIADLLKSEDTEQWRGKKIGLRSERVSFKGKLVPSIRVFDPSPPQAGGFGKPTTSVAAPWDITDQPSIPDPGDPIGSNKKSRKGNESSL